MKRKEKSKEKRKQIEELLARGVVNIIPGQRALGKALAGGKKLNVYLGIDPTATRIHLGHAVNLRKLQALTELGHEVTFLVGDFTALVGDNSDKESERPLLTVKEIRTNFKTYKRQASKLLDFSRAHLRFNSQWLAKLSFAQILQLCQQFSLNDYLSREIMKKKLVSGVSIRLDEILYPLMQGYDSYFMDTDLQIGAADQTFNMQAGRILQKRLRNKESFILVTAYLTGTDGRKMSKSWGNAIWLDDKPADIFGKIMSLKDELIGEYFLLATNLPLAEVEKVKQRLAKGENPMVLKKELGQVIVTELYSKVQAQKAQKEFERVFSQKKLPQVLPLVKVAAKKTSLASLLVELGLANSKAEARSFIKDGAVKFDGKVQKDIFRKVLPKKDLIVQVGRRRAVKLSVK